jgi:hypothetical protein
MTDNESTREDRDRYRRTSKDRDEYGGGEQGSYNREGSREAYKGGYDPGFLAG